MLLNIPQGLRELPQWVVAGPSKIPINPLTGKEADPADPSTGVSFEAASLAGYPHKGFILSELDPYTIIDLDDPFVRKDKTPILEGDPDFAEAVTIAQRHNKIFEAFPSYTELSQSGRGVHIIVKGSVPRGFRRDKVEVYSNWRYMICTGNVLRNLPVNDCQEMLDVLAADMGRMIKDGILIEEDPTREDADIWAVATRAANSGKFIDLCNGNWHNYPEYPSQSEADFGLMSMLAFYTRSNSQAVRMFRQTALGQRDKAQRDEYFTSPRYGMLTKIRSNETPLVDISKLANLPFTGDTVAPQAEAPPLPPVAPPIPQIPAAPTVPAAPPLPPSAAPSMFPPGLVGKVAEYILATSGRPVAEMSLAAAIALIAGIAGRCYNISHTGLNQYIIVLARTGRGKEEMAKGIDRIMAAVKARSPMADRFIGPATFGSGQGFIRVLDERPSFVSVLGEVGVTFQMICSPKASDVNLALLKNLLDCYSKSGHGQFLRPTVYSKADQNTKTVQSPCPTLLGESNPDKFFATIDVSHVSSGLIPRFIFFEYDGPRVRRNRTAYAPPPPELVEALLGVVTIAIRMMENNQCAAVRMEPAAEVLLDALDTSTDDIINGSNGMSVEEEIWNRAHLKALKLAGIIAVGVNPHEPVVTLQIAEWAVAFVKDESVRTLKRFTSGEIGNGSGKQEAEIRRLYTKFQGLDEATRRKYRCPEALLAKGCVPFHYLNIFTRSLSAFRDDPRGETRALSECLQNMVKSEVFDQFSLADCLERFKTRAPIYFPGDAW